MINIDTKTKDKIWQLLKENRRHTDVHTYTIPSPSSYPFQWFWDSCFHAIMLAHLEPKIAKEELKSLAAWQFKNGMIPHMIYWQSPRQYVFPIIHWGKRRTSSLIQPPMLAYAVWAIYEIDKDKQFLKEMYPVIRKLHHYLSFYRDPHKQDLIGLIHPDESGEDNSPRFDHALRLKPKQTIELNFKKRLKLIEQYRTSHFVVKKRMEKFHWVRDVPINAIFAKNLKIESQIAREIGLQKESDFAQKQSERVIEAMRRNMLVDGVMWSTTGLRNSPVQVKTWAIFAPMFAEALRPSEAKLIVENNLKDPKQFNSLFTVPTVALDDPSFDPKGFWRGPIWMSTNWFIIKGLQNYGFVDEAERIAQCSLKLVQTEGLREQYNPITGEGMGATEFTWGGLVLDM